MGALIAVAAIAVFLLILLAASVRVAREYERGVIFRLGRLKSPPKGPGLFLLIPIVDKMVRVDLRTVTLNVPPQEVITKDNVPVRVNAVAYFRIIDPEKAIVQIENFMVATSQISQTTLRSVLGQHTLDELLSERDKINAILQEIIDQATSPWGIKVSIVEVKDVEIPTGMQRAMARQAEAERERRAKVIAAEGEFQASERLKDAAQVLSENPMSLQLRFLQTMLEISSERSSTIILPVPIDLFTPFLEATRRSRRDDDLTPDLQARPDLRTNGRDRACPGASARSRPPHDPRADAGRARRVPVLRGTRGPHAAGDLRGRVRPDRATGHARVAGPRRPEPLSGARAAGGRRPHAAPRALVGRAGGDEKSKRSRTALARAPPGCARPRGSRYVQVVLNEGRVAGSSLPHSHSQLFWLREPPPAVLEELPQAPNRAAAASATSCGKSASRSRVRGDVVALARAGRPRPVRASARTEPARGRADRGGPRRRGPPPSRCDPPATRSRRRRSRSTPGCTRARTGTSSSCRG